MSLEEEISEEERKRLLKEKKDQSEGGSEEDDNTGEEDESNDGEKQEPEEPSGFYVMEVDEEDSLFIYDKFIHSVSPTGYSLPAKSIDYNKLFSYLGKRQTRNPFDGMAFEDSDGGAILLEPENDIIVSAETIERGIKAVKYFTKGFETMDPVIPYEGMDPDEFEKYKLWRKLNPHLVRMFMEVL